MPALLSLNNDSTPGRFAVALDMILEGRTVAFPGFSLTLSDDVLRIDVTSPAPRIDSSLAVTLMDAVLVNFDSLLSAYADYASSFSGKRRRVFFAYSDGKTDVETGEFIDAIVTWRV